MAKQTEKQKQKKTYEELEKENKLLKETINKDSLSYHKRIKMLEIQISQISLEKNILEGEKLGIKVEYKK